jgi:hypothetical protein
MDRPELRLPTEPRRAVGITSFPIKAGDPATQLALQEYQRRMLELVEDEAVERVVIRDGRSPRR